jgi:hypothetical protein
MPIDFPTSPTNGQVYTYEGRSWVYNGSAWDAPRALNEVGAVRAFADAAGRTAAIPSPSEGTVTYQLDTNFIDTYSGTAWVPTISNNSWTDYSPTLTSGGGTLTTASVTGRYKLVGKVCHVQNNIAITTNGTASGFLRVTLPFSMIGIAMGVYRENAVTGSMGQVLVSNNQAICFTSANGYPGGNSHNLLLSYTYEVA